MARVEELAPRDRGEVARGADEAAELAEAQGERVAPPVEDLGARGGPPG